MLKKICTTPYLIAGEENDPILPPVRLPRLRGRMRRLHQSGPGQKVLEPLQNQTLIKQIPRSLFKGGSVERARHRPVRGPDEQDVQALPARHFPRRLPGARRHRRRRDGRRGEQRILRGGGKGESRRDISICMKSYLH